MKKTMLLIVTLFCVGLQMLFAQSKMVSGTVTSAKDDSTLPGVSVVVKGTTIGTVTDVNGEYSIKVPSSGKELVFSFVGMKQVEKAISGNKVDVALEADAVDMDEVVVVAYGTSTKKALVGAVSSVKAETIESQINASPVRAIQGSSPGVNIITSGGQPGENPTIRIRGVGSNVDAQPLIVVDGTVFSGNLNSISSDQIESINVLKDASASAIYGSRASNGVLLITTKGGSYGSDRVNINVNVRAGFSQPAVDNYELMGAEEYTLAAWEAIRNGQLAGGATSDEAGVYATDNLIATMKYNPYSVDKPVASNGSLVPGAELLWDTDWMDALIRDKAAYNEVTFSADGGNEKMSYFVSANHLDQDGSIVESNFTRNSGRVNLSAKLTSWLEIGTNNSFSKSTQNYPNQSGSGYTNTMQWVNSISNVYPLYQRDVNGELVYDGNGNKIYDYGNTSGNVNGARPLFSGDNAVGSTYYHDINNDRTSFLSTSFIKLDFTDWLSFRSSYGYENYLYDKNEYYHNEYGHASSVGGRVDQERNIVETQTYLNSLNFANEFGDHGVSAGVFSEVFDYNYDKFSAQGTGFLPNVKVLSGSTTPESVGGYINRERLVSYMGKANYSYKDRYFFDVSFRADASTRFSEDNRWGNFYAVGASWVLSDEEFLSNVDAISMLKIRSSYGELGNNKGIGYFPYMATYDTGWNNGSNTGVLKGGVVDPNIKWEKTQMFNVGVDYGFFNDRISGTVEYYDKKSVDLLFKTPLAPSVGDSDYYSNIGSVSNYGVEFLIQTVNVATSDIFWKTSFNISKNINEINELPQEEITSGTKKLMKGKSLYEFFTYDYAGVDSETGDALWYTEDEEGNKVKTNDYQEAQKYYMGSSLPDFIGGFSSELKVKNFDFNFLFNYSFGGKIMDYSYMGLMGSLDRIGDQLSTDMRDRWQKPGDITDVPKLMNANNDYNSTSSRFLFDNDYVRLKSISLGYNLPSSLIRKWDIRSCKIYVAGDNIWTWQSHEGLDPEQDIKGTTDSRSNLLKSYSIGVKLGF